MSVKLRVASVGIIALFGLVVLVARIAPAAPATVPPREESQTVRVEYTVASSSVAARSAGAVARVAWAGSRAVAGPLSETLTLVVVGSMLLGLAAVVRRTD